jgi:hypothetical protein
MFKVFKTQCENCLLSPDSIVSFKARKEIIKECVTNQSYFICHKATMNEQDDICCKTYFDQLGHTSNLIRISQRLGMIEEVEQEESERLPSWSEMNEK